MGQPVTPIRIGGLVVAGVLGVLASAAPGATNGGQVASQTPATVTKAWTMEDLAASIRDLGVGRDWQKGRDLFRKTSCGVCHAFGSEFEGSGLAPDLTGVASKFTRDFILESILDPSATINPQFRHTTFTLKSGDVVTGSIVDVLNKKIVVAPVMLAPEATVEIAEADVKSEAPSSVSPMPAGLLNELTKDEIVELMAFLDASGDRTAAVYRKK
jgi:putative heme-binding domain-containing protein